MLKLNITSGSGLFSPLPSLDYPPEMMYNKTYQNKIRKNDNYEYEFQMQAPDT